MATDNAHASIFPTETVSEAAALRRPAVHGPLVSEAEEYSDACACTCACLLAKVDFKWLMSGQGWQVDLPRFQSDPSYAAGLLRFALASPSFALRESAASLQSEIGGRRLRVDTASGISNTTHALALVHTFRRTELQVV
jgi:hypothetical protein